MEMHNFVANTQKKNNKNIVINKIKMANYISGATPYLRYFRNIIHSIMIVGLAISYIDIVITSKNHKLNDICETIAKVDIKQFSLNNKQFSNLRIPELQASRKRIGTRL